MTLETLITLCGGKDNIRRILRLEDNVILELVDDRKRQPQARELPFNATLSQITWKPEKALSEQQWRALAEIVEHNRRKLLVSASEITPSVYRPKWHHAPKQGFLNDPNGFIYHQGEYHLFHGLDLMIPGDKNRYWVHYTSNDLVNWNEQPVALYPTDWFDCHGVYSGHAVSNAEELLLFYTGNVRIGAKQDRITTQCLATSTDGIQFTKLGPVITELPPNVTPHCRDPKIVRNGDHWLMLLGAQYKGANDKLLGRMAMYRSEDLYNWSYVGLFGDELGDFGYMWECPDLFSLDDQLLSVFCPQGIESASELHTIPHHCGYIQASLDADDHLSLHNFSQLDYGFDFYAPQTAAAPDGRRLLVAWMGMPDEMDQPSMQDKWIHQLTCLRELSWKGGKLYQNPIRELQTRRGKTQKVGFNLPATNHHLTLAENSFELCTNLTWPDHGKVTLRLMDNGKCYCDFTLDADKQRILLDRSHALPTDGESFREIPWANGQNIELQILADSSSLEFFINGGEYVMTARIFVPKEATNIQLISEFAYDWHPLTYWSLN
jgi:beta-fructofuranosidase